MLLKAKIINLKIISILNKNILLTYVMIDKIIYFRYNL